MSAARADAAPSAAAVAAALGAVYLIWGSTYLAIRYVVETMPPLLSAGARFLLAGGVLYAILRFRGEAAPTRSNWKSAAIVGGLLLLGGNGLVMIAEKTVPSGLTALIIALVPIWMVLIDWGNGSRERPKKRVFTGLALGIVGLLVLVGPERALGAGGVALGGAALIVVATLSWAYGSVRSKKLDLPKSPLLATAAEMLAGGALLVVAGAALGEWRGLDPRAFSGASWLGWWWLVVPGSLVAFSCYVWLLKVAPPARVSTYAYANPIVAVILGWLVADEPLTMRVFIAAALVLGAVVLITSGSAVQRAPPPRPEGAPTSD